MDILEILKKKKIENSKRRKQKYKVFMMNGQGVFEEKGIYDSYGKIIKGLNLPLSNVDISNILLNKTKKYIKYLKIEKIKEDE